MSYSWHLKRRYMQIIIKMLQVKYWPEATSMLRNHKHTRVETSTYRRWFNCSLSKQVIHLLLNNGMMSHSCLDIELPEVTEQGRMVPKLKMVTPNHIKHKPVRCNASPLILLATWMSLIPTLQVRPLSQRYTTRPWHRSLMHCEMEPSPWPGLATPLRGKRLRQTHRRLLLSLARDHLIWSYRQASLGGNTSLRLWRKGTVRPRPHNTAWKQN